jgi:maltose/moltooligosaccharide transporter
MERKFSILKTFVIGLGFLGINLVWPVFNSFVPLFLQAGNPEFEQQLIEAGREIPKVVGFGMAPSLAFFIMTWDNIFNVIVSPWSGMQSDRTWNRFGRRKPWILLGVPIAAIGLLLIPVANSLIGIMVFIVITNFGMALFRSPTVAWLGDLFSAENRSRANGIINLMGGIGGAIALFGSGMLFDRFGRVAPFIGTVVILILSEGIAVLSVKEPVKIDSQVENDSEVSFLRNFRKVLKGQSRSANLILLSIFLYFMAYEALQTGLTSFAVFNLGMTPGSAAIITALFAAAFILFAIPSGFISGRFGRKRMIMIGLVGMILLFSSGYFLIQTPFSLGFILILTGISWAFINVNSLPLVFDYGDEGKSGVYTGLYYVAAQAAAVSGPVLSGIVVDAFGNNYRYLWAVSAVYVLLAWLAMRAVKPREA